MSQIKKGTHRPILGCDIGNGFGYVSLLQQQAGDPLSLLPSKYQLSDLGMPTTAYVTPPDGAPIVVFQEGEGGGEAVSEVPQTTGTRSQNPTEGGKHRPAGGGDAGAGGTALRCHRQRSGDFGGGRTEEQGHRPHL